MKKISKEEVIVLKHITTNPENTATIYRNINSSKFGMKVIKRVLNQLEKKKIIECHKIMNRRNNNVRSYLWYRE